MYVSVQKAITVMYINFDTGLNPTLVEWHLNLKRFSD